MTAREPNAIAIRAHSDYPPFAAGEVVKSHSERLIANFLYLNGISYAYERPYDVHVADATQSQYRPASYYPRAAGGDAPPARPPRR
jgi:hypothetical protein